MKNFKKYLLYALFILPFLQECQASVETVKHFITHPTTTFIRNRVLLSGLFYALSKISAASAQTNNDALLEYISMEPDTYPALPEKVAQKVYELINRKNIPQDKINFVCDLPLSGPQRITTCLTSAGITINIPKHQAAEIEAILFKDTLSPEEKLTLNQFIYEIGRELEQAKIYFNHTFFSRAKGKNNFLLLDSIYGACSLLYTVNNFREYGFFHKKPYIDFGIHLLIEATSEKIKNFLGYREWAYCETHASTEAEILEAGITIYERPQVLLAFNTAINNNFVARLINRFSKRWAAVWATQQEHPEFIIKALKKQIEKNK